MEQFKGCQLSIEATERGMASTTRAGPGDGISAGHAFAGRAKPVCVVVVKRRLDDLLSGSGEYLKTCLETVERAGFQVKIVVAPVAGFGSRVYSRPSRWLTGRGLDTHWPQTVRVGNTFVSLSGSVWKRSLLRLFRHATWLIRRDSARSPAIPSNLAETPGCRESDRLIEAVNQLEPTLVVAEYSSTGPLLSACETRYRAVLLHDLFALRAQTFQEHGIAPDHEAITLQMERERLADADLCIYASLQELDVMSRELVDSRHVWLPPRVPPSRNAGPGPPHAVFLGVRHGGNLDALKLLLEEIWPLVREQLPGAELKVVGEICEEISLPAPPGVKLLGRIPDLESIGGPDAIGLAPVRAASGISIKVTSYIRLGMSVLASPEALTGYRDTLSDLVMTVPDPEGFASQLVELLRNQELRRTRAARGVTELAQRLDNGAILSVLQSMADLTHRGVSDIGVADREAMSLRKAQSSD